MYVLIASGRISTVYNNGAASANSSYNGGFAYDTTGKLQVDTAAVPTTKSFSNGIARHSDGVLCVNTHDPSLVPYAYLPGIAANDFTTPNAAANQITGDIDIRFDCALDVWNSPASQSNLCGKWEGTVGSQSYVLTVAGTTSRLQLSWRDSGGTIKSIQNNADHGITDGTRAIVKATLTVATGAVSFYKSLNSGASWTQIGTTDTSTGATSIQAGTALVRVGERDATLGYFSGKIYRAQIYNGINGVLAVDFNPADSPETSTNGATWVSSTTGETWTLNNTGADPAMILGIARGQGGLFTDNSGALYVSVGDAVTTAIASIPVTAKGAIAVSAVT